MRPPGAGCTVAVTTMGLLVTLAGTAGPSQQSAQTTEAAPVVIIAQDAPSPLVVHARKALASGSLAKWERNWYEKIVAGAGNACPTCHGEGTVVTCIDDLCRAAGTCMHGDGEGDCPDCGGSGFVEDEGENDLRDAH